MKKETENKIMPDKALRAMLACETDIEINNGKKIEVKPISISTMATLDMIKSPMLYPDANKKITVYDYLPSFYAIIKGYKICMNSSNLVEDAFDYFDTLGINLNDLELIKNACFKQLYIATELANNNDSSENKKK